MIEGQPQVLPAAFEVPPGTGHKPVAPLAGFDTHIHQPLLAARGQEILPMQTDPVSDAIETTLHSVVLADSGIRRADRVEQRQ